MKSIRLRILLLLFVGAMPSGLSQGWSTDWSNGGNDYIAGWNLRPEDKFLSGEFVYVGWTELFAVHPSGFASLLSGGTSWWSNWGTSNGWIGPGSQGSGWNIGSVDQYLLFKPHNSSLDYIFAVNATTHYAMLLYFSSSGGNHFVTSWSNGGLGTIGGWSIASTDRYVSGNFSSAHGSEEVLFINPNGWATLQYAPSGQSWSSVWSNGGSGGISGWSISSGDRYQAKDFDGDGIDELLCVSGGTWSAILKFNGSGWTWV